MASPDVKDLQYSKIGMPLPVNKTHADFNNNPGNIKGIIYGRKTDFARYLDEVGIEYEMGSVAADGGVFIKFKTPEDGYRAAQLWWPKVKSWKIYGNRGKNKMTLNEALRKYSGGGVDKTKGYDLEKLKQGAEGRLDGIDGNTDISEITDDQWAKIMNEQMRWEDVNYYNKLKEQNIIGKSMTVQVPEVDDQSVGAEGEGENVVINDDDGSQNIEQENIRTFDNEQDAKNARDTYEVGERVVVNGVEYIYKEDANGIGELINEEGDTVKSIDLTLPDQYTTRQFESIDEAKNDKENFNDGDTVVIGEKVYRYDKDNDQLIVLDNEAQIVESVSLDEEEVEEEEQEEVVEEVEEEVVTEERADDPNTPARGPEPKESDRQRVEVSDMQVGKYYTILDPEKSEIVDDTGNLQDGVVELVAITENGEYEFQNTKTGKVFRVPADGLSGKLAQTNRDDVTLPQYNGVTILPDTTFILDGKAYSREDLRRIGGGTVKDGINKLTEGKTEEEKKKIFRELAKSQTEIGNIKGRNSQIFNIYGELPDAVDADSGGDGILDKDGDGIPDTIDIDAGEGSNQVAPGVETPEDKPEGDKPEGETTNLQRAGEIGKNLLQGVGTLLDAVGGPGAIVSYIMGKKGMEAAMKEIEPQAMPELSPMFMQHLRQAKELAKRGFHPDQEREFRKELDTAYGIGLENAVRGSGGQRARFLAQSGILDAQRSSALLDFAAKDAELQAANQDKYEKVMLFKENFDLQRSEQQRAEDMARQREEKEAAAGFVGSAFSSLMNSYSNMNTSAIMNKMVQSGMQNLFNPNTIIGLRNQDAFKNNETYQNITDQ